MLLPIVCIREQASGLDRRRVESSRASDEGRS
jgi:hypothetical protein